MMINHIDLEREPEHRESSCSWQSWSSGQVFHHHLHNCHQGHHQCHQDLHHHHQRQALIHRWLVAIIFIQQHHHQQHHDRLVLSGGEDNFNHVATTEVYLTFWSLWFFSSSRCWSRQASGLPGFLYLLQESSIVRCTIIYNHSKNCNMDDGHDDVHDDHLHQKTEWEEFNRQEWKQQPGLLQKEGPPTFFKDPQHALFCCET